MNVVELFEAGVRKYAEAVAEVGQVDPHELTAFVTDLHELADRGGFMGAVEMSPNDSTVAVMAGCGECVVNVYEAMLSRMQRLGPVYSNFAEARNPECDIVWQKSDGGKCIAIVSVGAPAMSLMVDLIRLKPGLPEHQAMIAEVERANARVREVQESN